MAGTTFTGPVTIESAPGVTALDAVITLTDNSGGTAAATIAAIGAAYSQAEVRNAVASLAAAINRLAARIQ